MIDYLGSLGVRLTSEQASEIARQSDVYGSSFIRIDRDKDGNRTAVVLDTTRVSYMVNEQGTKWEWFETDLERRDQRTSKIDPEMLEQTFDKDKWSFQLSKLPTSTQVAMCVGAVGLRQYQHEMIRAALARETDVIIQKCRTPGLRTMAETHRINGDGFQLRMMTSPLEEMPEPLIHHARGWYDEGYPWYGAANAIMMQAERDLLRPRREAREVASYVRRHTSQRTQKRTRSPRGAGFQT